jgi:hypothetical protein
VTSLSIKEENVIITQYDAPRIKNVLAIPTEPINLFIIGLAIAAANPNPMMARPGAKPLVSGNHLTRVETGAI